jgi:ferredoxin-type protein NapG
MSNTPENDSPTASSPPPPTPPPAPEAIPAAEPADITPVDKTTLHAPVTRVQRPKAAVIIAVEQRSIQSAPPPQDRRKFFDEAMRETLGPLSGMLERKINPILAALEALPYEVDRMAESIPAFQHALDQPLLDRPQEDEEPGPRTIPLPLAASIANNFVRHLRPPGAIEPHRFEATCSRCGKCAEVCPANAILIDGDRFISDGHPYIVASGRACVVCTSLACMNNCPSGALKPVDKFEINLGTARVDPQQCVRDNGEDCRLCVETCPLTREDAPPEGEAIAIDPKTGRVHVRKNICIGCGMCEQVCPTDPRAIWVVPYSTPEEPIIA